MREYYDSVWLVKYIIPEKKRALVMDGHSIWETWVDENGVVRWKKSPEYDYEKRRDDLEIVNKAHEFALRDDALAAAEKAFISSKATGDEQLIIGDVNNHISNVIQQGFLLAGVSELKNKIAGGETAKVNPSACIQTIKQNARHDCQQQLTDLRLAGAKTIRDANKAKINLNIFCVNNKIGGRAAIYPESYIWSLSLIIAFIVAESVVNLFFFAQGSSLGFLGGWMTALLTALANVLASTLAGGFFYRYTNHCKTSWRCFGWIGFIALCFFVGLLHLAVAHYRELAIRMTDVDAVSFVAALTALKENPFGFQDMLSLVLIIIGVFITIVAMRKGYSWDDPYPGYGDVYRRWKKLDDAKNYFIKNYHQSGIDIKKKSGAALVGILISWDEEKKKLERIRANISGFFDRCAKDYEQVVDAAKQLLNSYWGSVRQVHQDVPLCPESHINALLNGLHPSEVETYRNEIQTLLNIKISELSSGIAELTAGQDELNKEVDRIVQEILSDENRKKVTDKLDGHDAESDDVPGDEQSKS